MYQAAQPMLGGRAKIKNQNDLFVIEDDEVVLTYEGESAELMRKVHTLLDGSHSLGDLSKVIGTDSTTLSATLRPLYDAHMLVDIGAGNDDTMTPDAFMNSFQQQCAFYRHELFAQPFWHKLRIGEASRNVVLGWGIEMYHYVSAANEHMAVSVAHCRENIKWRHWLARHYVEEHNHDAMFLAGLVACGFEKNHINCAPALPGTRALIDFLYELASSDTFGYAATFGVMQTATEDTTELAINAFYDMLNGYYPYADGVFTSFRNHALVDVGLDHQTLVIEHMCRESFDILSADAIIRASRAVRDVTEHFMLFFENILDYYGDEDAPIPRRPLDIRILM